MIELEQVSAAYPGREELVLNQVSLRVATHETVTILGGSGTGKSTVLKAILRLIPISHGRILIHGEDCARMNPVDLRRTIGMVFQGSTLFPHLSARENIALVLKLGGMSPAQVRKRSDEVLDLVGLDPAEFAGRYPHQLSGGQQQRVGVARALAPAPAYLLMDEPFGALDAINRRAMQNEVKRLRQATNVTILFVTHDVMEAANLGDRIAVMDEGRVLQVDRLRALMERPAHPTVEALVGHPLSSLTHFVAENLE